MKPVSMRELVKRAEEKRLARLAELGVKVVKPAPIVRR